MTTPGLQRKVSAGSASQDHKEDERTAVRTDVILRVRNKGPDR